MNRTLLRILLFILAPAGPVFLFAGCNPGPIIDTPRPAPPARAAAGPLLTLDSSTTSTLSGSVVLDGAPPAPRLIDMSAEPVCRQMHPQGVKFSDVVTGPGGALADVVVFIRSGLGNYRFPAPSNPVQIDQKGCLYNPRIVALMVGQRLEIRNSDSTLHNIHSMARENPTWNRSEPEGATIFETFPRAELAVPLVCNVHPWMRGFAFVFDNPYYAITGAAGKFTIPNLPPGDYTMEAWQERYGVLDQAITIAPHSSVSLHFTFHAESSH